MSAQRKFPHHKEEPHDDGEHIWLVSYADMVTLLLGFFILLLSFSKIDPSKLEKVKQSATQVFGGEYKVPFAAMTDQLKKAVAAGGLSDQVAFQQTEEGVQVTFRGALFFDSGSATLRNEATELLKKVIPVIKSQADKFDVVIEGHTDNVKISGGMFASNWELSSVRACSVLRVFEEYGFNSKQLMAIGWGETKPIASNETPEMRSQNRRVVVRIVKK